MPIIASNAKQFAQVYDSFDTQQVGLGTIEPNIFASKGYQKKKTNTVIIGTLNDIVYAGMEHDKNPLILPMAYETNYNTILAYNLNYLPVTLRKTLLKLVMNSNVARIKAKKPIIVDYYMLKRAMPVSTEIVRRYKVVGIRVNQTYRLVEWEQAVQQKSKWSRWYQAQHKQNVSESSLVSLNAEYRKLGINKS